MHLPMPVMRGWIRLSNEFHDCDTEVPSVSVEHFQRLRVDVNVQQLRERLYNEEHRVDFFRRLHMRCWIFPSGKIFSTEV